MEGLTMQKVIIDSCGWVAIIEAGLNIDSSLMEVIGPYRFVILDSVRSELQTLNDNGKNLLLDLLDSKAESSTLVDDENGHTDDQIVTLAEQEGWLVLTVDRELKRRLVESSCRVIEVVSNKRLRLVAE
jgi:rRNA-processing protein FCF1